MQITVNGDVTEIPADFPVSALIEQLGLGGRRIAVEVNCELVPKSRFDGHRLQAGDRVEIIHAVGGG